MSIWLGNQRLDGIDENAVHKTGDETIAGNKTFITKVSLKDEAHALGTYSSDVWGPDILRFTDQNNTRTARVQTKYITGTNIVEVGLYATSGGAEQGIRVRSNGYTYAPTPAASSNDNSIATTAWVNGKLGGAIFGALYPVGSIYIGTQSTCPLTTLIPNSTWELVATDRALWGGNGSNGNTTIAAGLPNLTGYTELWGAGFRNGNGVFSVTSGGTNNQVSQGGANSNNMNFNASGSNSIYGNSTTVQPPAYRVNVWRRTA